MRPVWDAFFRNHCELLSISEAIAAVNRTVGAGLKGNLALLAALGANGVKHLTFAALTVSILSCHAAISAALRLVSETFFSVELLLTCSKSEFLSAILADEGLVFVHLVPLKIYCFGYLKVSNVKIIIHYIY